MRFTAIWACGYVIGALSRFEQMALMCSSIMFMWGVHFKSRVRWMPRYLTGVDAGTFVAAFGAPTVCVNVISGALASVVV